MPRITLTEFQFQCGTIKRQLILEFAQDEKYFNSNVVRLKVQYVYIITVLNIISIPMWYD